MKRVLGVRALVAAPLVALVCFAISAAGAGAAAPDRHEESSRPSR